MSVLNLTKEKCSKIIHDIKTPAASIQMGIDGIKQYLPCLIEAYAVADKNALISDKISPVQLKALSELLEHLNAAVNQFNYCIEQLSINLKEM